MIILSSGELLGLFFAVTIVVYAFQESQPKKMLHFYVLLVILFNVRNYFKMEYNNMDFFNQDCFRNFKKPHISELY